MVTRIFSLPDSLSGLWMTVRLRQRSGVHVLSKNMRYIRAAASSNVINRPTDDKLV